MYSATTPHNDLPPVPPLVDLESKAVLKRCASVRAAITELRVSGELIPDQSVLINAIPILEAKDSSEIENIVTTNDVLFKAASLPDDGGDPAAKEALRYRAAMYQGVRAITDRPLATRTIVDICRIIKGVELDIRKTPGTALRNSHTGETIYTPPEGEARLRSLLANWERFLNEPSDIDPVVRMAVLHYQFEAIHPFTDGNGRTGRILNILCLMQDGLLDQPTLYMSRHILRTKGDYYRLLLGVTTDGAWEAWILYCLTAVEETCLWTVGKVRGVKSLMDATSEQMRREAPKIHSRELVDAIFRQPYSRITHLVDAGLAKRQTASVYLKELVGVGILEEVKAGREKLFLNRRYLDLLGSDEHTFPPFAAVGPGP